MIGCGLSSVMCGLHSHQAVPSYAVLQHIIYPPVLTICICDLGWLARHRFHRVLLLLGTFSYSS